MAADRDLEKKKRIAPTPNNLGTGEEDYDYTFIYKSISFR